MKAFHIADTHIKMGPRWDECRRVLDHFARRVEEERPNVVLHAGDVFDGRSNPKEMEYAERWFQRIGEVCPVVIVGGNHDDFTEIAGFNRLESGFEIKAVTVPQEVIVAGLSLLCIPWPTLSGVLERAGDLTQANATALDHLRAIFAHFGGSRPPGGLPRMALMHAMVTGSKTAAGQPLRNCDFSLGLEDLAFLNCEAIALGHIHKEQEWHSSHCAAVRYSGSPFHTDWGDWADKSFTIWEYDSEGIDGVITEALPAHQMLDLKTDFHADEGSIVFDMVNMPPAEPHDCGNSELRLTYSFVPEEATAAHLAAKRWREMRLADGAADVKLNPQVIVTTSARIPEVTTAIAPEDKLKAYMRSRGEDPESEDNQRVLEKFSTLVEGTNASNP